MYGKATLAILGLFVPIGGRIVTDHPRLYQGYSFILPQRNMLWLFIKYLVVHSPGTSIFIRIVFITQCLAHNIPFPCGSFLCPAVSPSMIIKDEGSGWNYRAESSDSKITAVVCCLRGKHSAQYKRVIRPLMLYL